MDANDRFCARFYLSVQDDFDIPLKLAYFVHRLCKKVRKRCDAPVELDDIGFATDAGLICGYVQWRTPCSLRSVVEWTQRKGDLFPTEKYGGVYYETDALVLNWEMLGTWHKATEATVECVSHFVKP